MIVEPVPTNPRSPVRRGVRLAGVTLPLVLLVGVVAVGSLGPKASPPRTAGAVTPDPAAPGTSVAPGEAPAASAAALATEFPDQLGGLEVLGVAAAIEARRSGGLSGFVAVAGYLTIQDLPAECVDRYLGPYGAFCERRVVLADVPNRPFSSSYGSGSGFGGLGAHLHPTVPLGVRLPHEVVDASTGDSAAPVPVAVLGRFVADDPPCATGGRHCGEAFVIERVSWVDGEHRYRTTIIDPALEVDVTDPSWRERRAAARAALGFDRTLLMTAYLRPATLERIDPAAAGAVHAAAGDAPLAVWYIRALQHDPHWARYPAGGAAPRVVWAVFDDASGTVIARGAESMEAPLRP
ncbi:MAG: hypothetical protein A2V85_03595 [Chloroflexi bacterium RBG_16_72_14]|nr:MAG: hypothetical protein A2V85_03595 [Chloroflexi bacterium RBG_16_72_14]